MFIKLNWFKYALALLVLHSTGAMAQSTSSSRGVELTHEKSESAKKGSPGVDENGEVLTAHDLPQNDPSPKNQLTLVHEMSQKHVLFHGVSKHLNRNIRRGLSTRSLKELRPWFPTIAAEEEEGDDGETFAPVLPKKFTFLDAVEDESLFEFLKIHEHRYTPKLEFGPSLVNADHEFKGISDRKFGYCWGFSTLDRYFTVLAFFDPSLPRETSLDFYKEKIDQVVRGEATVIPGFSNFREFSLIPELELYLKLNAMELWRSRAVRWSSIKVILHASRESEPEEVEATVSDLEARIARGELPKIIFSALIASEKVLGQNTDIHVVLPFKVERLSNGHILIRIWDINFYTETLVREPKFLEITPDHRIHYRPWYEPTKPYAADSDLVSSIQITPENDRETLMMMLNLKKFCSDSANKTYCELNQNN